MSDSNPLHYNGGVVLSMAGDNCVSIASDHRFGMSQLTLACDAQRIEPLHDRLCVGLAGLATDCTTLAERFRYKHNMYRLREKRVMRPRTFAAVASSTLYEKRFAPYFTEVVIAGLELEEDGKRGTAGADAMADAVYRPYVCSMDLLGALMVTDNFALAGTCAESLYGTCETFWRPGLDPDALFEVTAQSLLAALDRDCMSGWGAVVHVLTPEGITTRELQARMD